MSGGAWYFTGNADERFLTLAVENLLVELARAGRSPLAVYCDTPPFGSTRVGVRGKDRLDRHLQRYTSARIPGLRLQDLSQSLLDARRRRLFVAEGAKLDPVLITGPGIPGSGLPTVADAVALLIVKGTSTPGWVYQAVRPLASMSELPPISIVVLNAECLEEAAVFFHDLQEEVALLLRKVKPLRFAGYLKFDPDYTEAARRAGRPLVEHFPGCPFHGQVKYVLRSLSKAVAQPPAEHYFSRMAGWQASQAKKR
ncbi:MAG: hypothetical protein A2V99_02535 [Spirochaetes bacterium RBG_16_67_19]|nr:MAG: hypothetical protein A2V99_02535 [Spirochaetes bacterium RBG_16_67_19]